MSKTVEERARKYATKRVGGEYIGGFKGDTWLSLYQTYIEIATEQRAIDYAKACNTFCKFHCGEKKGCMCEDLCKFSTLFTEGEE